MIALVAAVALIMFAACFVFLPPVNLATRRLYHHPSFATNQSSVIRLQNNLPSYTNAVQNIPPDFSSSTTLFHKEGTSYNFEPLMKKARDSIDFSSLDSITNYFNNKGPFRFNIETVLLAHEELNMTKAEMEILFYNNGGSCQDAEHINTLHEKIKLYRTITKTAKYLNTNELIVFKQLIPSSHHSVIVPFKLKELSFQIYYLAEKIKKRKVNPIAAAAYIHQEIIRIQPFQKDNADEALLWMNLILQMGGFKAFAPSEKHHLDALIQDISQPGSFVSYIEAMIKIYRELKK